MPHKQFAADVFDKVPPVEVKIQKSQLCLLYTSDAADERSSVDLGGRRIIKKKTNCVYHRDYQTVNKNIQY